MNNFFLQLPIQKQQPAITYTSKILLLGSCFVEHIGDKLTYHKFEANINPFGIVFHPEAIEILLNRIVEKRFYVEEDLFFYNEQWHCFEVHSQLSTSNKDLFLDRLNTQLEHSYKHLSEASHLILTFGSAWGYELLENNKTVANCHKIPQKNFRKKLSSVSSLEKTIQNIFNSITKLNPSASILTTISPVRHIKDGIVENNRSKANLLAALHTVVEQHNQSYYFPAYELVMDCLREYRFYKADLIHPNPIAINFIWEHFKATWMDDIETLATLKQVQEIQLGIAHRPFDPNSEAHQKFIKALNKKKQLLLKKHHSIVF